MSWFKNAFKTIFGKSSLNIGDVFNSVSSGLNNLVQSSEERAKLTAQFVKDTLGENTIRSKTRRFIAVALITNTILLFWVCVFLAIKGMNESINLILDVAGEFNFGWAFITIIVFFFGGYYLKDKFINNKKDK